MKMINLLIRVLEKRIDNLKSWLKLHGGNCAEEQLHLNQNSKERIYWNYGYLMALIDVVEYIKKWRKE